MPEEITGQVIYELFPDCVYTWDRLPLSEQRIYNIIAERFNAKYINPLQGLVRQNDALKAVLTSYRVFVKEAPIVSRYVDSAKWRGERADLLRMVDSLLKDEQEEG